MSRPQVSSANGGCPAPLMVAGATAVGGTDGVPRRLGSEPPLYTVTLAAGQSKTVSISGLSWS